MGWVESENGQWEKTGEAAACSSSRGEEIGSREERGSGNGNLVKAGRIDDFAGAR